MHMMTVPGVGPIASLRFKAAVDDPTRFNRSRTVGAHFGLTPRHDNWWAAMDWLRDRFQADGLLCK